MSTLRVFADPERLRVRSGEGGELEIRGRAGAIYVYGSDLLGVCVLNSTPRKWGNARRACLAAGMQLRQDGHDEGSLTFDPSDQVQAALAIRVAKVRRRKRISEETRARLAAMSHRAVEARSQPLEAPPSVQDSRGAPGPTSPQLLSDPGRA